MQGAWAGSLDGELRFHILPDQKIQNINQKWYCNKFNKDFKNGPHKKKKNLKKKAALENYLPRKPASYIFHVFQL